MKNQIRFGRGARLLALLMSALLLMSAFPAGALAAQKGSLTVKLKEDTYANLPKTPAVAVTLYQIGEAAPTTKPGWRIFEAFSGYNILGAKEDSELGAIAARMGEDIVGKDGFSGTEKTLQNGQALFSNLDQGVYLGVLTGGPEGLEVDPFIVTVPVKDPKDKKNMLLNYSVTLKDRCVTEATVRKEWDDKDNQDGIRPASLTVKLSNGQSAPLNEANQWTATIKNLPRYKDGKAIVYTWTEEGLPEGYELAGTATDGVVTTLKNRHVPETTSATVRKVWDDANNQDGIRPASLTVKLSNGQSVTLNEENKWEATLDDLPKYDNGKEIAYTWTEEGLSDDYKLTGTATNGAITTLTNIHTPETVSATVRKVWDDANDQDGIRPESLTVKLSSGQSVTLNEANKWEATITNLPKYENGKEIAYTWTEEGLPEGYKLTATATDGAVTALTNSHTPETTSATVRKVWNDANNQDGIRPASLTVKLSNGQSVTLNEANKWTATIDNLPKYDKGKEIAYTWTEEGLPEGYTLTGTTTEGTITTLTNSHTPGLTSATVRKVWDDANNRDGIRPASLTVKLSSGQSVTLNEDNEWTATINDLPMFADGKAISYTWTEEGLPEGYALTGTATEGSVTTLTNTYTPATISATVRKIWDDANDQDGIRPANLTVTLLNESAAVGTVTLSEANGWTATIDDLPKYDKGKEIAYSWTEEALPKGYMLIGAATEGTITTLTNSHVPDLTSATVRKVWDDNGDQDGVRPASLSVTLMNGETAVGAATLNAANGWTATIDGLPKYQNGKAIAYTWVEGNMPAGYQLTNTAVDGTITTLTNSRAPELTSATVRKVWDDANNQDGIRPANLMVTLSDESVAVGTVTLNDANGWTATIDGLPKYRDGGKEIVYTWSEEVVIDYTLRRPVVEGNVTTLTNAHTPGARLTQISGEKVWDDNQNEHNVRPANITVTLYADGQQVNAAPMWRSKAGDRWSYTFNGLPLQNAGGATINYTVDETPVEYYTTEISGTTITNHLIPKQPQQYTDIKGVKKWEDNENSGGTRPDSITVRLIRNGVEVASVKISQATNWSYIFEKQPVDDGYGNLYHYEVREDGVPGYFCRVDGMNLINKLLNDRPDTPNIPTTRRQVGSQYTATGRPQFEKYTAEELEDMLYEVPLYGTPLWGGLLGTGDVTPLYPFIFGGIGVIAVIVLILIGRKRKKGSK